MSNKVSLASNNPFHNTGETFELQQPGSPDMPADYRDPNHPLAPVDLETQVSPERNFSRCTTKKIGYIAIGVAILFVALLGAFLIGQKVSHDRSIPSTDFSNVTNTTVQWNSVTMIATQTAVSFEALPPTTVTQWITITPIVFAPPSSTSSFAAPVPHISNHEPSTTAMSPAAGTEKSEGKCLIVGTFGAKDICEYHCIPVLEGKDQQCDVRNGRWTCIRCDAA